MTRRPDRDIEAELTALADGSLAPERRAEVGSRIAASPELAALLAEQRRAVSLVRGATAAVEASAGLRARVEAQRSSRRSRVHRPRLTLPLALAAATAVTTLAVALALPGGAGGPSVADAADLGALSATTDAPQPRVRTPKLLALGVDGAAFPSWERAFAWRATGSRRDRLDGRETATVFYAKGGRRIAYTIAGGPPLDMPENAGLVRRKSVTFRVFERDGRIVVAWLRLGHSCVLSGADVVRTVLLRLASWDGKGAVPF